VPESDNSASAALRAISVLEAIAGSAAAMTLAQITDQVKLPKPTVFRLVTRLEKAGLLVREPSTKAYSTGHRLTGFAVNVMLNSHDRGVRHRILESLVEEIGETVNCTMLDGSDVVYLDRVETAWPLRLHLQPGSRVPLHCTASGKLFLAHMPKRARDRLIQAGPLLRYTEKTIVDPLKLEKELARIRKDDYSLDDEEFLMGMVCLAVPVYDLAQRLVAAVALHAPKARMSLELARDFLPAMRDAAAALARTYEGES
jgi:DNA-binding IclR family transcriptional regulator